MIKLSGLISWKIPPHNAKFEEPRKLNILLSVTMHISPGSMRKRKRGERVFRFESFCQHGYPTQFHGTFQENIKALLEFGHSEANVRGGLQCWSFQLELQSHPHIYLRLFIAEELVGMSLYRQCWYCRIVGWGHHMICNQRFHFILPSKKITSEVDGLSIEDSCKLAEAGTMGSKSLGSRAHLMQGVMHSNGFGHLLCINGIEGGSEFISGQQILDFWDRMCVSLKLRKVSLIDVARKATMELRLLHGIAYGEPWFGRWGYKFGHGSYGITQQMYQKSLAALQALPLCLLIPHFSYSCHVIPEIIARYETLCGRRILTLGDLFHFIIQLKNRLPRNPLTSMDYHGIIGETQCRWSVKRVEMAAQVIVSELRKSECKWVSRQEVRDAARAYIGDTGLLDYVLKSLGNHVVGNYIVRRVVNPVTKVLEYCLENISASFAKHHGSASSNTMKTMVGYQITSVQLMKDLLCLYKHILMEQRPAMPTAGIFGTIPMAVRVILDTKHLVKDYLGDSPSKIELHGDSHIKLQCIVCVKDDQAKEDVRRKLQDYELVKVPIHATMAELKREVERYFREMYWGLKGFCAAEVVGVNGNNSDLVLSLIKPGQKLAIEGRLGDGDEGEIFEGGNSERIMDCLCGAKEDDGERMISCDICEVMQHTRCMGIPDSEEAPRVFLCSQCERDIVNFSSIHDY